MCKSVISCYLPSVFRTFCLQPYHTNRTTHIAYNNNNDIANNTYFCRLKFHCIPAYSIAICYSAEITFRVYEYKDATFGIFVELTNIAEIRLKQFFDSIKNVI